jgi:hypothetical protein
VTKRPPKGGAAEVAPFKTVETHSIVAARGKIELCQSFASKDEADDALELFMAKQNGGRFYTTVLTTTVPVPNSKSAKIRIDDVVRYAREHLVRIISIAALAVGYMVLIEGFVNALGGTLAGIINLVN